MTLIRHGPFNKNCQNHRKQKLMYPNVHAYKFTFKNSLFSSLAKNFKQLGFAFTVGENIISTIKM